ncbi:MAG: hypothetical protein EB084_24085, partial [Proteobacteria bacterium]|nr:hypothetical protein [Pseudomonadota bacterium]
MQAIAGGARSPVRSPFLTDGSTPSMKVSLSREPEAPPVDGATAPDSICAEASPLSLGIVAGTAALGLMAPGALRPPTAFLEEVPVVTVSLPVEAARAAHEDMASVPVELLGSDGRLPAVELPAQAREHYAKTVPLVDRMLDPEIPEEWRISLRRDIGVVPASLLERLTDAGLRIWVVPAGQTSVPDHVFRSDTGRGDGPNVAPSDRFTPGSLDNIRYVNEKLASHAIDGAYLPSQRMIVLREEVLPDPAAGQGRHRVALHELGHAVDHFLGSSPELGKAHQEERDRLYAAAMVRGADTLVTTYARTDAGEHYADAFEAWFTADRGPEPGAPLPLPSPLPPSDGSRASLRTREPEM